MSLPFTNVAAREAGLYKPAKTKTGQVLKGILRGAPRKVLNNPFASNLRPKVSGVKMTGVSFSQS